MFKVTIALLLCLSGPFVVQGQNGDKAGETQALRVAPERIPTSPQLSPAESLKRIQVPAGYQVQLIASEPMIEAPVAAQFDPDGRLYVLEMRGYMRSPDAVGENQPISRISILSDPDGDGRMDERTTFLDGLVMPRAMALYRDGLLVGEPPNLWFWRDINGDGKADEKVLVASDYGDQRNPEHTANGLVLAMDNWIYNLYHTWRYRFIDGKWERQPVPNRVQWGLSQDDFGRLFFTQNSDLLRADLYSPLYAGRAQTARLPFMNFLVARDQSVWPSRVNPGVNRGYQPTTLRDDGTLAQFTAACGTVVYRGDNFPQESRGQVFVCEPSANLIRQQALMEDGAQLSSSNAWWQSEFLRSSDERFRPVNLLNAPDGSLCVVDIARGIIQHRIYMTSYLRRQVDERRLDRPLEVGRIYRVVHQKGKLSKPPRLSSASSEELVRNLSHPNGWWRDTAQRLLVDRMDTSVVPSLARLSSQAPDPRTRLHAAWTLEGLGKLNGSMTELLLRDPHPKVRSAAVRLSEPFLRSAAGSSTGVRREVMNALEYGSTEVRVQTVLTLGRVTEDASVPALLRNLLDTSGSEFVRQAAALGLGLLDPQTNTTSVAQLAGLSSGEVKRFQAGKELYTMVCAACHQPHGLGQEGLAPPLVGSEWVAGSPDRLARVVLHGVRGPLKVKGQVYQLEMPPLGILEDEQIAQVITYIRREWGHSFPPVDLGMVKKVRQTTAGREAAWTEAELLAIP